MQQEQMVREYRCYNMLVQYVSTSGEFAQEEQMILDVSYKAAAQQAVVLCSDLPMGRVLALHEVQ